MVDEEGREAAELATENREVGRRQRRKTDSDAEMEMASKEKGNKGGKMNSLSIWFDIKVFLTKIFLFKKII